MVDSHASAPTQPSAEDIAEGAKRCRQVLLNLVEIGNALGAMVFEEANAHRDNPKPATEIAPGPSPVREAVAAYEKITRAVRRTVMLYDKLCDPKKSRPNRIAARKRIIRDVEDAIEANAPADEQETLHAEFLDRLDRPDLDDEIADRSIADIVTDITRDLGISGLYDGHPWKRRIPHDIAIINARAEQVSGAGPSEKLAALLASAPPPPPRPKPPRRHTHLTQAEVSRMSDEEIESRLKALGNLREL
jgi:hypothetical protein